MKLFRSFPNSSIAALVGTAVLTALFVSAFWFYHVRAINDMNRRLLAAEEALADARQNAAEETSARQREYLKKLSSTLKELEEISSRIEPAAEVKKAEPFKFYETPKKEAPARQIEEPVKITAEEIRTAPPRIQEKMTLAENFLKARRYYKALEVANEIDEMKPRFPGSEYIRFQVNKEMGFDALAARSAEHIIKAAPRDAGTKPQYLYLIDFYLSNDQKRRAEEIFRKALRLWPGDPMLQQRFKAAAGADPSFIPEAEIPV